MVLKSNVLEVINVPKHRVAIAAAMGCTEQAVINYIKRNDEKLTQYAPLMKIKEIMDVLEVSELLTIKEVA